MDSIGVQVNESTGPLVTTSRRNSKIDSDWPSWYYTGVEAAINDANYGDDSDACIGAFCVSIASVPWVEESGHDELLAKELTNDLDDNLHLNDVNRLDPKWDKHCQYFVWSCRGTVFQITQRVQETFHFEPRVTEAHVGNLLNGFNSIHHLKFLEAYLPDEDQTIERAADRFVMCHTPDDFDLEIWNGEQPLDAPASDECSQDYRELPLPPNTPENWTRHDDAVLYTFLGSCPETFIWEYGQGLFRALDIEFVRIRAAQTLHMNLSKAEIAVAWGLRSQVLEMLGLEWI